MVLFDLLHVDVVGVQILSGYWVVVKFGSQVVFQDFVRRLNGCSFQLPEDGGPVIASGRSGTTTYVVINRALFEFPEDLLRHYFAQHGCVLNVRMKVVSSGRWKGVLSGTGMLVIRLRTAISSSIQLMGLSVRIFYAGQPRM